MEKYSLDNFIFKGLKNKEEQITIVILTTKLGKKSKNAPTTEKLIQICKDKGIRCIAIDTEKGSIQKTKKGSFIISSKGMESEEIFLGKTIILTRRSSIKNNSAKGFFKKIEDLGFPCVNSYDSVNLCENKLETIKKLQLYDIPTPKTSIVSSINDIDNSVNEIGGKYPVVCKFLSGTKGIGVFIINSRASLISTLQAIWRLSSETEIVLQELIDADYDIRIHILAESDGFSSRNYKVIAAMKRLKIKGDFRTNYSLGGETEKIKLTPEIKKIAIESAKATGCLWCGVDIIIDKKTNKPYVLEVNASPGTKGIEKTTGINVTEKIINFLLNKKNWIKPKKVTGFREMVTIPEIGKFVAKLDTGNGATSCSIHADEIYEDKDTVYWSIKDKKFVNKIIGHSKAEVGDHIHERAVINLDINFNGVTYKNVKFSLVNRTEKSTPILLNRNFLSLSGLIVDSSEDFIITNKPSDYSPKKAKGNPYLGIILF